MFRSSFISFIFFFLLLSFLFPSYLSELKFLIPTLLGLVMFGMGMTLKLDEIKKVFKKPLHIIVTIFLQFSIMPLLALFISIIFDFSKEITLGFLILGACPGGTASNVIAYICRANVPLSILSTFASTTLAIILTPLYIYLLADQTINIDLSGLMKSTFFIIFLPVSSGFIINTFLKTNKKILNSLPVFSEITIALIISIIFAVNFDNLINISYKMIFGVVLHNLIGLVLALKITQILNYPEDVRKTVAIEVAMQNSGLGMTLALIHFSKIVALPSAIFSLWHNISAAGLVYLWKKK